MDLTVHNAVKLIKFSNETGNSFSKISDDWRFLEVIREEFKTLLNIWDRAFSVMSYLALESKSFRTSKMELFAKIVKN